MSSRAQLGLCFFLQPGASHNLLSSPITSYKSPVTSHFFTTAATSSLSGHTTVITSATTIPIVTSANR